MNAKCPGCGDVGRDVKHAPAVFYCFTDGCRVEMYHE